jgi:hypothetical protein
MNYFKVLENFPGRSEENHRSPNQDSQSLADSNVRPLDYSTSTNHHNNEHGASVTDIFQVPTFNKSKLQNHTLN